MGSEELCKKRLQAVEEFNRLFRRSDGAMLVGSLAGGLTLLRDLLYVRLHEDVEEAVGTDSMLRPASEQKVEQQSKLEIDIYQVVESAATVEQRGYLGGGAGQFRDWLARLRLDEMATQRKVLDRIARYVSLPPERRRLALTDVLSRVLPESREAPLVLFRLIPLAVATVTSAAFGDHRGASEARTAQISLLPAIADCRHCRGAVLENGEECHACGNPLWKFEWLKAID